MTLLHLIPDDKFVDMAVREFEAVAPGQHEWLVLDGQPPWRYLKDARVRGVSLSAFEAAARSPGVTGVVLHTLYGRHFDALAAVPQGLKMAWLGWGYDYYGMVCDAFPQGYVMPTTAALLARLATPAPSQLPCQVEPTALSWARPYARPTPRQRDLLARIDIFSPVIDSEFQLVRRHVPQLRARYLRWNYGTVEDDLRLPGAPCAADGPNLLVGNSATATNNHLELFDLIRRQVDLSNRQLIVPLSYGDAAYRHHIVQRGRALFGQAFVPLIEFLPLNRYIELLGTCGHVLMNHVRQQALGNLVISGLMGAKLHLPSTNPLRNWLRSLDISVSDIDGCDFRPLPQSDREHQIRVFETQWGRESQRQRTSDLVEAMKEQA